MVLSRYVGIGFYHFFKGEEMEIMKDKGAWVFDEKTIIGIKNNDSDCINKFYFDNLDIIKRIAYRFRRKHFNTYLSLVYSFDDLINQVYVDLPFYDYKSRISLYFCIVYGSFLYISYGGYRYKNKMRIKDNCVTSYNIENDSEKGKKQSINWLVDSINFTEGIDDFLIRLEEKKDNDTTILEYLKSTIKNPIDFNYMYCKLFTDLPLASLNGNEYVEINKCK